MKKFSIGVLLVLLLVSCDYPYINGYWWIKNNTGDSLIVTFINRPKVADKIMSPGDSLLIHGEHRRFRYLVEPKDFFIDNFILDSLYVRGHNGGQAILLDCSSGNGILEYSSWDFYTPIGYDYNYVWVYGLYFN